MEIGGIEFRAPKLHICISYLGRLMSRGIGICPAGRDINARLAAQMMFTVRYRAQPEVLPIRRSPRRRGVRRVFTAETAMGLFVMDCSTRLR
jgi:hypothetical protein